MRQTYKGLPQKVQAPGFKVTWEGYKAFNDKELFLGLRKEGGKGIKTQQTSSKGREPERCKSG